MVGPSFPPKGKRGMGFPKIGWVRGIQKFLLEIGEGKRLIRGGYIQNRGIHDFVKVFSVMWIFLFFNGIHR